LVLTVLTIAALYLITKKPSTADQLVILTVPSGAMVALDGKEYGRSPVKLEKVPIGTYRLTITKDGFQDIYQEIVIDQAQASVEFRLKPLPPSEAADLSPEQQIAEYRRRAEEAFGRAYYAMPYEGSALYYTDVILGVEQSNQFALELRERIRKALHQSAESARARGYIGQAQEIYDLLVEYYPKDDEARAAQARLESVLSSRRGEVRDLIAKAQEALRAERLVEPEQSSAYYYAKQALAIDRQNKEARAIRARVKEVLLEASEQTLARGDPELAIKRLEEAVRYFPEDTEIKARLREWVGRKAESAKANDPEGRRRLGLEKYRREDFGDAIPDLEFALTNGRGTADVIFALARSHQRIGHLDQAASYFSKVPEWAGDTYCSAIAALGDVAVQRGETPAALSYYRRAIQLGGSTIYSIAELQDKIDRIEKRQRDSASQPSPVRISVRHSHGTFQGSCKGALSVDSSAVRFDGEHTFVSTLAGLNVVLTKDKLMIQFQGKSQEFRASPQDAAAFRDAVAKYQAALAK
jgi:tetratricopeptide (TPR) repeat protein